MVVGVGGGVVVGVVVGIVAVGGGGWLLVVGYCVLVCVCVLVFGWRLMFAV